MYIKSIYEFINDTYTYKVYHASSEHFDVFDVEKISNIRGDLYGKGFYFTNNYDYAKNFGKYIYLCNVRLQNPLNLTNDKTNIELSYLLERINNINDFDLEYIVGCIKSKSYTTAFRKIRKYVSFEELKELYDGVIGYCEEGGKEYVVYNPNDIVILEINKIK
jgi:hypothetical protein